MPTKHIISLAILIRLLLVPLFYHPDMKSQNFHFQFLSHGVNNIYQYIADNKENLPYRDTFNYLPLTYYTFGTIQAALKPFMPSDFSNWINDWSAVQNNYANLPYFLLILKTPYIILDIFIAYLLYKISKSKLIFTIWLFNPLSFYLIYILGNFDILPVFLTLLSLYILKKSTNTSLLLFGIAIALKLYPLLLLPFYILSISKNPIHIIKNCFIALIPLILTVIPFANNSYFWQSFFGSGLTQKIIEQRLYNIPIFPAIYILLLISTYFSKTINIYKSIFYIFLLFVSVVNFHPQWLLWFLPFIFLQNNFLSNKFLILFSLLSVFNLAYIFLFNDNYLFWGHLIPIDSEFIRLTSPFDLLRYHFLLNPLYIQNHIKLAITVIAFIFFIFNEKNLRTNNS
jgi:hypothetical protein